MKEMKDLLGSVILEELKARGVENAIVNFDYPTHMEMGDLSTNVAMVSAGKLKTSPIDLANEIKEAIQIKGVKHIKRVDVIKPGFINFFFDEHYFAKNVDEILNKKEEFGKNNRFGGEKVTIEYTDPNIFKEFHIGHLMPNVVGESLSRIIENSGAKVKRVNYQSDIGLNVAKAVWAAQKGIKVEEAYAYGHKEYEENEEAKGEIIEINKKIYEKSDSEINKIYEKGRKESLNYFEKIYKLLGTKFDHYFFESEVAEFGKETVEKNIGKVFEKSEGAVVFKGEKFDKSLHTRVFINKENLPTYEAKELGLAKIKYDVSPYDLSIIVTGDEINEYFRVLIKAMLLVFPDLAAKTKHISHGMLKLSTGKMSSRTGNVITAESLIAEVKEKVLHKMKNPSLSEYSENLVKGFSESELSDIAEVVSIGAIKYSILHQAIGGDIIFDFDKSISFVGDSGPYLQYSTVRANSILRKSEGKSGEMPSDWETTNLERFLERFPGVVEKAGKEYASHYIATYLINLAGEFNSFYSGEKISGSPYRLALTEAFIQVMNSGLYLLGIKVPERM